MVYFGSQENILKAKLEILEGLNEKGKIILNNDNSLLNKCDIKNHLKITYGIYNVSNFMAKDIISKENSSKYNITINKKEYRIEVPLGGEHFIYNSLCSIAVGLELKIDIYKIIEEIKKFKATAKRNEIIEKNDIKVINDYYNASYDSMKASLEVLSKIRARRKIAILGDMLELGKYSEEIHKKVGEEVVRNKIDILCVVGGEAKYIADKAELLGLKGIYRFSTNDECIKKLQKILKRGDCILLKASNKMKFGEISKWLQGESLWKN